jgi:hypothetical protein
MNEQRHCWPTPWLEAAMRAGFAYRKPGGEWVFLNDKMREMLAEFGLELQEAQREHLAELMERQHTWISNVAAAKLIRNA